MFLTTYCGFDVIPRYILPRYSPISPRNSIISPEKKQMHTITEYQPTALVGAISFFSTMAKAPSKLSS